MTQSREFKLAERSAFWYPGPMGSQDLTSSEAYRAAAPVPGTTAIAQAQLAGFWRRLGAYIVDGIVLGVVFGVLFGIASAVSNGSGLILGIVYLILIVGELAYFGYLWSSRGQTIGYMALGLRLVRTDGTLVGPGRAVARLLLIGLSFSISGIPAVISAFMVGMGERKQAIHDLIVDTLVVRA